MTSFEQHLVAVQPLLEKWGYTAVFGCIFVEGIGIPAPGQTLLMAGAFLAARGELALLPLLGAAILAAATGNALGWVIGRAGGRPLLHRFARGERLARVEGLFERWGAGLVAFGRFIDGVRQLNGLAAGALGMGHARFLFWNTVGAFLWAGFWGLGAYEFGRDFDAIGSAVHRLRPLVLPAVVLASILGLVWLMRAPWRQARR